MTTGRINQIATVWLHKTARARLPKKTTSQCWRAIVFVPFRGDNLETKELERQVKSHIRLWHTTTLSPTPLLHHYHTPCHMNTLTHVSSRSALCQVPDASRDDLDFSNTGLSRTVLPLLESTQAQGVTKGQMRFGSHAFELRIAYQYNTFQLL